MFMVLGETISKYVFHITMLLKHSGYPAFFISHLCSFHFKFEMKIIQVFPGPIVQIFSDYLFEWKRTLGQIFMVLSEMISKYVFHITMLLKHSRYLAFFISHTGLTCLFGWSWRWSRFSWHTLTWRLFSHHDTRLEVGSWISRGISILWVQCAPPFQYQRMENAAKLWSRVQILPSLCDSKCLLGHSSTQNSLLLRAKTFRLPSRFSNWKST